MARVSILGVLSTVQILWHTMRHGKFIGTDTLGNKYYTGKPRGGSKLERRWVIYKDQPDASNVPPEWHGWLHHQSNVIPGIGTKNTHRQPWQKPHKSNKSGSDEAYFPPGHVSQGSKRQSATGDYVAWTPKKTKRKQTN